MDAICEWHTHHDRFRRCTHLDRSELWPDRRIRIRPQLDPNGMGHLAGSRTGVAERRVERTIGSTARLLLRNASVCSSHAAVSHQPEISAHIVIPAITTRSGVDAFTTTSGFRWRQRVMRPVLWPVETVPSQVRTGRPTDHDSSHARSRI